MANVSGIFEEMKAKVAGNPAKVATMNGSYQFDISGDEGGTYHAAFDKGSYDIGPGPLANPGVTISMTSGDFVALVGGKLNPMAAFMSGKIKVKGDMSLAMQLQKILG